MKDKTSSFNKLKEEYNYVMFKDTQDGIFSPASLQFTLEFFKKIKLEDFSSFVDLGSGDGRIAHLASLFTKSTGIESEKTLARKASRIKKKLNLKTNLLTANFLKTDLSTYDIIFINPDTPFHNKIEEKLIREAKNKVVVYSKTFTPRFLKLEKEINIQEFDFMIYSVPAWTRKI